MNRGKKLSGKFLGILFVLVFFGTSAWAGEVNLSAAASMKEVINDLSDSFSKQNAAVKVMINYGGSGALAKQIENGAPADIFISANQEWMDYLNGRKMIESESIKTVAYNALVFVGDPTGKIVNMQDVLTLQKIAIGSPKSVPAGEYAMEALKRSGIDRQLEGKLVMAKDVRECLMYAERGEVDGAFVYRTDALQSKRVKILFTVPQKLYPRVTYPMGLTLTGAGNKDAEAFYKYLQGEKGKSTLGKYGFAVK
jgi:molybdate transport system substrate-binding protein